MQRGAKAAFRGCPVCRDLGGGGDAKPNLLSGLGLPGFNPFKK
jgi:signal recognition particle subunit SRP54